MAETFIWNQTWTIFTVSFCLLLGIILILLCCLCWERKENKMHHFYILDENGLKRTKASELPIKGVNLFRRLSNSVNGREISKMNIQENSVFSSANLPFTKNGGDKTESALLDNDEYTSSFDKSVLKLSDSRDNSDNEEALSCISADSKTTFYSIYPRRSSKADTFVSVELEVDKLMNR